MIEITFVPHNHTHEAKAIGIEAEGQDAEGRPVYKAFTCTASGTQADVHPAPLPLPLALILAAGAMATEEQKYPGLKWELM